MIQTFLSWITKHSEMYCPFLFSLIKKEGDKKIKDVTFYDVFPFPVEKLSKTIFLYEESQKATFVQPFLIPPPPYFTWRDREKERGQ